MTATTATQTWLDQAACLDADPDLFFPTSHGSGTRTTTPTGPPPAPSAHAAPSSAHASKTP